MSLIKIEQQQQVLVISLNRPHKMNALTFEMYVQMAEAIEQASQDSQLKAVLLKGEGESFTAGNDLQDFAGSTEKQQLADTERFMHALKDCLLPVVAQVHGLAVGIGTTLLLHCDLVYCSDDSKFVLPFINLALVPEYASSYLLPKIAGHRKASEWLMLGEPFGAKEAVDFGLVNQSTEADELQELVQRVLAKIVAKPRQAMAQTKALMKYDHQRVNQHMNKELDVFVAQLGTEAAKEAFSAFLEKRKPDPAKYN